MMLSWQLSWHYTCSYATDLAAFLLSSQKANRHDVKEDSVIWQHHKVFTEWLCNQLETENSCSR
jgi:hypothetical protein